MGIHVIIGHANPCCQEEYPPDLCDPSGAPASTQTYGDIIGLITQSDVISPRPPWLAIEIPFISQI